MKDHMSVVNDIMDIMEHGIDGDTERWRLDVELYLLRIECKFLRSFIESRAVAVELKVFEKNFKRMQQKLASRASRVGKRK